MYLVLDIFLEYFDNGLYLTLLLIWFRFNVFQNNKSIVLNVSISLLILLIFVVFKNAFFLYNIEINIFSTTFYLRTLIILLFGIAIFIQTLLVIFGLNIFLNFRWLQYLLFLLSTFGVFSYENPITLVCCGYLIHPYIMYLLLSLSIVSISYLLFTINTSNPFFRKILNYFLIVISIQLMSYSFHVFEYDNYIKLFMIGLINLEMIVNSINKNKISS